MKPNCRRSCTGVVTLLGAPSLALGGFWAHAVITCTDSLSGARKGRHVHALEQVPPQAKHP